MAALKKWFGFSNEIGQVLETIDDIVPQLSEKSIANQLFTSLDYRGFKEKLRKCQTEVTCVTSGTPSDETELCVLEVKVKPSRDGLAILTESEDDEFCRALRVRGLPRAFLVSSESVSMIEAKLAVYRKFKYDIDDKRIRIHHKLDDPEDFLNHCGHFTLDRFQRTVEELKNSVPVEVIRIVTQAANHVFSHGNIRNTCREIYLIDKGEAIGTVWNRSYVCRAHFTVRRIKENLVTETLRGIGKAFCKKILQYILEHIRSRLEINADLHKINFSNFDETFMNYSVHIHLVTVVDGMLSPLIGLVMTAFTLVFVLLWSVDINSFEWRDRVADEIYDQLMKKQRRLVVDIIGKVKGICENTLEELCSTATKLQHAKNHVCCINQKEVAEEWMLRDIRIEGMEKQPTILRIISGRVGHRIKVKVFLASVDEEIKQFVKENAKSVPKDAEFVFVDTSSKTKQPTLKGKAHSNDQGKRKKLYSIVKKEQDKLFAKHSNIIAIGTSLVRQVDQELIEDPCIVIYCLDKELIPFGEKRLPDKINGVPCDIREDFLLACTKYSHRIVHGCTIGSTKHSKLGTAGFLACENINSNHGFLTAAHVALSSDILGQLNGMRLTEIPNVSAHGQFDIIHPYEKGGHPYSEVIGEVTESYYGNHDEVGIDAAFVKLTNEYEEELYKRNEKFWDEQKDFLYPIEAKVVRREGVDVYGNLKVYKHGTTTGVTEGLLNGELSVNMPHPLCKNASVLFKNCFEISDNGTEVFFEEGDSGSGVYLLVEDTRLQPLAIAFCMLKNNGSAVASPLENVLSTLDVSI